MNDAPLEVELDAEEQRVLGCLLEKQKTVPASYPLTANSLKTACNQLNSREPVVNYDDKQILAICHRLKDRGLIRVVWSDRGQRTLKYHQVLDEVLVLPDAERALLTVLLLRGPQSAGELKTRTERLFKFADRDAAHEVLTRMAALETPLVRELARRHGEKDTRWIHLLGPVESGPDGKEITPSVDREIVLADGGEARDARVKQTWGAVAEAYAEATADQPASEPFESWLLTRVGELAGTGPVVEVGCGPGHVTAFLADLGVDVVGQDFSAEMIEVARQRHPELTFEQADLRQLMRPATASGWAAVVSWYSLIHFAPSELPLAIGALARVVQPGGLLVIGLQTGDEVVHHTEFLGTQVDAHVVRHQPSVVLETVRGAGLSDIEWYQRGPVPGSEEQTDRLYVIARKP